jgi:serine/threonine-protein kinase RsbW
MDSHPENSIRLDEYLTSTLESVDRAEAEVSRIAAEGGFAEEEVFQIGMAVREGMVNAVVHGNRYSEKKKVRLTVISEPARFVIRIEDEGEGFDLQSIPDPTAEENLLRQSGRGLLLIRSFVDEVRTVAGHTHGTALELIKHRNKAG